MTKVYYSYRKANTLKRYRRAIEGMAPGRKNACHKKGAKYS
jgi:hypothetical protein